MRSSYDVTKEDILFVFSGNMALDTLWGTCIGSVIAGNPVNSYIIGGELLEYGVSLMGVTAFIVAWVNVGLIQLPVEMKALGWRFALVRTALSFILTIVVAILTGLAYSMIMD